MSCEAVRSSAGSDCLLGDVIDFVSRFVFPDVLELIRRSGRRPVRQTIPIATSGGESLVDIIALAFTRSVERVVGTGLAKGYRTVTFRRPPYPGNIDVPRHIGQLAARPDPLSTSARRITRDIEVNRALFAAIGVLHRTPARGRHRPEGSGCGRRSPDSASRSLRPATSSTQLHEPHSAVRGCARPRRADPGSRSLSPLAGSRGGIGIVSRCPRWARRTWSSDAAVWPDYYDVVQGYGFDLSHEVSSPGPTLWSSTEVTSLGSMTRSTSEWARVRREPTSTRWSPTANASALTKPLLSIPPPGLRPAPSGWGHVEFRQSVDSPGPATHDSNALQVASPAGTDAGAVVTQVVEDPCQSRGEGVSRTLSPVLSDAPDPRVAVAPLNGTRAARGGGLHVAEPQGAVAALHGPSPTSPLYALTSL